MQLKKKVKIFLVLILLLIIGGIGAYVAYNYLNAPKKTKEVKVIEEVKDYGYKLKDNKTETYKTMFKELKEILNKEPLDEEKYVKKISEMFIYDFYSLEDKLNASDVGGVDFVYSEVLENYLQTAQNTYYKYVENNLYGDRKQNLPIVDNIEIANVEQKEYKYKENTDEKAFYVSINWGYTSSDFSGYQNNAVLVFIHDGEKLSLVELQ